MIIIITKKYINNKFTSICVESPLICNSRKRALSADINDNCCSATSTLLKFQKNS